MHTGCSKRCLLPRRCASSSKAISGIIGQVYGVRTAHGAGRKHEELAKTAGARLDDIRRAIVNPSRLSAERREEVCIQCHLETTSFPLPNSIQRYDRGPFAYRPGETLGAYWLFFDHAPGTGRDDKFEIVNAVYRLRRSKCFVKSSNALQCTSCHNPHEAPRGVEATRHYDAACRKCHAFDFNRAVAAGKHTRAPGCADCHMPKRRTEDVVHAVATQPSLRLPRLVCVTLDNRACPGALQRMTFVSKMYQY